MDATAKRRRALLATSSLAALVIAWSGTAQAQTSWQGTTSTDWFVGTNWSTNTAPTGADNVIVEQGHPNADPVVGNNATSNAATASTVTIGDLAGTTGALTVTTTNPALPGNLTLGGAGGFNGNLVTGPLMVGDNGTGSLTITNGGAVVTNGNIGNVVIGSVGTGTITVGSATAPNLAHLSTLTNNGPIFEAGNLIVGDTGTGTLIINPDGSVTGFANAQIGHGTGGQGTVVVNGGNFNVLDPNTGAGELDVGLSSRGTMTVENSGMVTSVAATIGTLAGSSGTVTVTGANSIWNITGGASLGGLSVGSGGTGSLSILTGTVNATGSAINIGAPPNSNSTGTGTVTLFFGGRLIANGSSISIGVAGAGISSMTVDDGSRVTSDGASIGGFAPASFNGNAGATGTVTVNGGSSVWDAARDVNGNVDAGSQLFIDNPTSTIGLAILQRGQVISGAGFIGDFSTHSINSVVVDSVGSQWTNLTSLSVGYSQTGFGSNVASAGFLDITRGGRVSAPTINVGVLPDGGNGGVVDSIVVSQGSHLQASGTLTVGLFGTANLTVDTAAVTSGSGIIGFSSATPGNLTQTGVGLLDTQGVGANSVGTVLVTGAGANWTTGSLIVGDNATTDTSGTFTGIGGGTATGILTVADGGAINSTTAIQVALNAGSTGTINIGAADGQAAAAPGTISAPAIVFGAGTGTLVFNHTSTNYVFDASIQGAGSVIVDAGTTALTAVNSYTGATTINGGVLEVDGSLTGTSSVTVNAGGILTGSGTIDPPLVAINNGGSLLGGNGVPGSSTKIVGNLVFQSGASYMVGLDPTTSSLASVTGTATLGGATAEAFFANGSYIQKRYTILTATGGVSGSFGSLTNINLPTNLTDSLSYDANDVFLDLSAVLGSTGGLNGNQQNVANAINSFFNGGGAMPPAFASLFALSGDNLAAGLTQLSGETAIGSQQTTFDAMNLFLGLITDPFITGRGDGISSGGGPTGYTDETLAYAAKHTSNNAPAAIYGKAPPLATFEQRWSVWAAGFGGSQTTDGNTVVGSNSTTSRIAATAVGADYRFSPDTLAGLALAGGGTSFSVANGGTGRSDLFQAGAFVRHNAGPAYITAALAYGWQDVTTNRTVTIAGLDQLQARFNANAYSGRVEGGYRFVAPWTGGIGITPYAAGQFTTFDLPAYAENAVVGTNAFALAYGAKTVTDPRSELGIRTDKSYAMSNGILILRGRFAWAHDYDPDRAIGATFQTLPGASFVVNGAAQAHDSALTTASAEMKWMNGWSAAATFEGEFSNVTASYAGKGVLRYQW